MEIRSVSSAAVLKITAIVFGVIVALRFLWIAHAIFIVTFLGVLLGLAVARAADVLERLHIRRGFGAPLVILTGIAILVGLGALLAPSVQEQSKQLSTELPKLVESAERWLLQTPIKGLIEQQPQQQQGQQQPNQQQQQQQQPNRQQQQQPKQQQKPQQADQQQEQGGLSGQLGKEVRGSAKFLFPLVSSVFGAIGGLVLVIFIAMYVGAQPGVYRAGIVHLVPHRNRKRADEVLKTLAVTLRQWLVARLMAMVVIGTVTGIALALLNVKGAAALGVLAGLLEFVPFFGPVVSAVPAIGVAMLDSPQKGMYVLILYLVMQQLEGNVITPLLLERRLDIPPVLTVVGVASLGMVFGVVGMLIAEPLLAAVLVATKMLYVNDVVGDDVKVGKGDE